MKGLGRRPEFDERSRAFPVRALLRTVIQPRSYTWSCPLTLDQGQEGACVGFAFAHEASARPVKVHDVTGDIASSVYVRARQLDEWEGEDYSGTSILAGVKACKEIGWYREYRWAFGLDDMLLAIGYKGPVVLGVNWYAGMVTPDADGVIHVEGELLGGHAILANGVSIGKKMVRLHNSWGPDWGIRGECFIGFDDLRRLLQEQGEACVPLGRTFPTILK